MVRFRDIGAMATYKYKPLDTALFTAYFGLFNGEGPTCRQRNNDPGYGRTLDR